MPSCRFSRPNALAIHMLSIIVLMLVSGAWRSAAQAAPVLKFDFGRVVECRDVTHLELVEEDETRQSPNVAVGGVDDAISIGTDEKVIDMNLRVSVHLLSGRVQDVQEIHIEVSDCDRQMRVVGFDPETRLESIHADAIERTETIETSKAVGASLGGEVPLPVGNVVAHLTPTVSGSLGSRKIVTEKQKRLAPKQPVVVSGTVDQEHGVFFKLIASPQSTLEGLHEFQVWFIVPRNWRGDAVRVSCQATGDQKILWMKQHKVWSHSIAPVALYLAGDEKARRAAEQYVGQK